MLFSKPAFSAERDIRIGIVPKADSFVFVPEGSYQVSDVLGNLRDLVDGKTYVVKPSEKLLSLGSLTLPARSASHKTRLN